MKTAKIASEWSVPSFAILSMDKQTGKALGTGYQQARPIRIKRGIKEPDDPKTEDQSQVKEEKMPVMDITEVKKKNNLQGVDPPLQCRWDPEPKLSPQDIKHKHKHKQASKLGF